MVLDAYFGEANARDGDDKEVLIPDGWQAAVPTPPETKVNEEEAPPRKRRKRKTADKVTC